MVYLGSMLTMFYIMWQHNNRASAQFIEAFLRILINVWTHPVVLALREGIKSVIGS